MSQSKFEKISSYSVMVIALSALIVSVWQVKLYQDHNKLSVKPYLDYHLIQSDSLTVSFSNQGLGPAIINNVTFKFNGKIYPSLMEVLTAANERENILQRNNYPPNSIIPPGEKQFLLRLKKGTFRNISVIIAYKTIYEEHSEFRFSF